MIRFEAGCRRCADQPLHTERQTFLHPETQAATNSHTRMAHGNRRAWPLFALGLILLIVGSGPLITVILLAKLRITSDPNPNPVLFGIMALFSFWPAIALVLFGIARLLRKG
jgi:hypothetical protein